LTNTLRPSASRSRAARPGENPPGWLTASTTSAPSRDWIAARTLAGVCCQPSRIPSGTVPSRDHGLGDPPSVYHSREHCEQGGTMATQKQRAAARGNVKKAAAGAKRKRSIANMPAKTRSALGKQGAAVARRKRTGASTPKTRAELYEEAKRKGLPGRSKMGRDQLAKALGHK
jgi:hypothetical protein